MPCLVALFALISPRLAIFLLWLFTDRMTLAFTSGWLGIFGFLFLPWTTLTYVLMSPGGVSGLQWAVVAFGFLIDIGSSGGGGYSNRQRNH